MAALMLAQAAGPYSPTIPGHQPPEERPAYPEFRRHQDHPR
jgi:hypothetical protein